MSTVEVRNKQEPIPDEIMASLGLQEGSKLEVQPCGNGILLQPKTRIKTGSIKELWGILPKPERPVTLEEMEEAISSCSEE